MLMGSICRMVLKIVLKARDEVCIEINSKSN